MWVWTGHRARAEVSQGSCGLARGLGRKYHRLHVDVPQARVDARGQLQESVSSFTVNFREWIQQVVLPTEPPCQPLSLCMCVQAWASTCTCMCIVCVNVGACVSQCKCGDQRRSGMLAISHSTLLALFQTGSLFIFLILAWCTRWMKIWGLSCLHLPSSYSGTGI